MKATILMRRCAMGRKVLENVRMGDCWTMYIGAVDGVLRAAGWWSDETYLLMGMTGMAFHFIMHKAACPSSVTVYPWDQEHLTMLDRIGVYSEIFCGDATMNTFELMQREAIERIKASIDRGMGVVVWAPSPVLEFGIVNGYDDEDGVFFIDSGIPGQVNDPLLYTNLGKSEVPLLFWQIFKGKVEANREKVFRDSLKYGIGEWNKVFHMNPDYASGRKAYDNLIGTLERGDYGPFGLCYNMAVYADAKDCLARYLGYVAAESPGLKGLGRAASLYREVAADFKRIAELVPFRGGQSQADGAVVPEVTRLVKAARPLEEEAMAVIEKVIGK